MTPVWRRRPAALSSWAAARGSHRRVVAAPGSCVPLALKAGQSLDSQQCVHRGAGCSAWSACHWAPQKAGWAVGRMAAGSSLAIEPRSCSGRARSGAGCASRGERAGRLLQTPQPRGPPASRQRCKIKNHRSLLTRGPRAADAWLIFVIGPGLYSRHTAVGALGTSEDVRRYLLTVTVVVNLAWVWPGAGGSWMSSVSCPQGVWPMVEGRGAGGPGG